MKKISCSIIAIILCAGCVNRSLDNTITKPHCDTLNVTYKNIVQPILRTNCYPCHASTVTASGGLDLENYTSLKTYLQLGFRGDNIYGSKLYHCMLHSLNALPMPPDRVLDTCSLQQVKRWLT